MTRLTPALGHNCSSNNDFLLNELFIYEYTHPCTSIFVRTSIEIRHLSDKYSGNSRCVCACEMLSQFLYVTSGLTPTHLQVTYLNTSRSNVNTILSHDLRLPPTSPTVMSRVCVWITSRLSLINLFFTDHIDFVHVGVRNRYWKQKPSEIFLINVKTFDYW